MNILARLRQIITGRGEDPPSRLPSPDELALVARPQGEPEALMLKDILAQHGVHALVRSGNLTARGGAAGGWWSYELWVLRRDLRRARELLEGAPPGGGDS